MPIGTRHTHLDGSVRIKTEHGWITQAHLVGEELLGRPLLGDERVSFRDGDPSNLSPENVEIWARVRVFPVPDTVTIPSVALANFSGPEEFIAAAAAHHQTVAKRRARQARWNARRKEQRTAPVTTSD